MPSHIPFVHICVHSRSISDLSLSRFPPGLSVGGRSPARNRCLQSTFDPKELAVDGGRFVADQTQHQVSSLLWIVSTRLFHPANPLPVRLSFRPHLFGFGTNGRPHLGFNVSWVNHIGGHTRA